jgi:signal transduction histidine kinase
MLWFFRKTNLQHGAKPSGSNPYFYFFTRSVVYLIIVLSNIAIMFVLEISWPELFSDYKSKKDQVIDNYIGLMISSSLITLFAFSFKNYFNIQSFISQQSDVQKSKFMKNVSHKIRTPLNSIVGFTELITDTNTTQSDKEQYKELIWINSKMLTHLIDNIIDLADIESGQLKMNPSTFNIVRLIENIVNEANTRKIWIGKKNIEINFEKNDFEILVFTDERKMEQIINNLLINALEYCHQGYVTLKCYKDKTKVYVTIADTGIGIRDENLELIFNRFYSWEGDHRNEAPKTGIGLYLTWK